MTIEEKYISLRETPSDINEHLDTLRYYAFKCEHITEMGFRWGCSTYALLAGRPDTLISYDIVFDLEVDNIARMAKEYRTDFQFINKNVLSVEIEPTDLLFLDTFHHYLQLKMELKLHAPNVMKYIILHDTTTFDAINESIAENVRPLLRPEEIYAYETCPVKGLGPAIREFLAENPQWHVLERFENNNGLLILGLK